MASSLVDLVKINVSNTGSGAITLGSAVEGYRGRDVLTNGTVYSYSIQQGSAWEFGRGTYLAESAQIIRSVIDSSDGGTALNLKPNAQIAFTALSADLMPQVQLTADIQAKVDAATAAQTGAETAQGLSEDARDASVAAKDISVTKAGEAAASATAASASETASAGYASSAQTASSNADADAAATAADRSAVATDRGTVTSLAAQVVSDRAATAGFAASAQAISFASSIDSKGNIVIGIGSAGPNDVVGNSDGNGVIIGNNAGVGLSQTYSRKPIALGSSAGINFRGYAAPMIGAYTGARGVSDYAAFYGTHAGQDVNQVSRVVPGYGARATGSITFSAIPSAGDTVTVNGVAFTCAASPATAYEFAPGTTAAEAARNLLRAILGVTDAAIIQGFYRLDSTTAAAVNVASGGSGSAGNSFTLAKSGANITVSGATLTGGTDYSNDGNPLTSPGDIAMGFAAMGGTSRVSTRRAAVLATIVSNPANGDFIRLGFNLAVAQTVTFLNTPVGALDVQIGATAAETLANLVAVLNGSTNTVIDDVTYWARNGTLFIEHDSNNVNTFECRSWTSAIVFEWRAARGGSSNIGSNTALGWNSMVQSVTSGSIALGYGSGSYSTGINRVTFSAAGTYGNGSNVFLWGTGSLGNTDGDDIIALGNGIASGALGSYLSITGVSTSGIITMGAPHGWRIGNIYALAWRDGATSGATIQRAPTGTASWANAPAGLGGLIVMPINTMQVQIIDGSIPSADTGGRGYDYRTTGTATNLQIARYQRSLERSITLGSDATARNYTITLGHSSYRSGVQIDAIGLNVAAGDLRLQSIIAGTFANGRITFPTNFVNNETISFTDGTSTFTMTAKDASAFNTITTGMQNWFEIDTTSVFRTIRNLVTAIRNNDDQSTARRVVNRMRLWLSASTGSPSTVSLNWQALDTNSPALSLSTTRSDATVIVTSTGTMGNLPTLTSANPPNDGGLVMITSSPIRNARPGLAQWDATNSRWNLI